MHACRHQAGRSHQRACRRARLAGDMAVVSLRRVREGSAPTRHTTPSTPRTRTALLTDCVCHSQVDVNKQTKRVFTRKNFVLPDHKKTVIKLDCEHRVRWCLKEEVNFPTHTLLMRACARTHPPTPNRPSHTHSAGAELPRLAGVQGHVSWKLWARPACHRERYMPRTRAHIRTH